MNQKGQRKVTQKDRTVKISLITTERNEVADIATFIESALNQSLPPDEIVIADGGSTDGTVEVIQKYIDQGAPIKLVHAPGNRSVGRNAATQHASHEYIACSDVGSKLDKHWLKNITEPFRQDKNAMVVSGGFKAAPETYFEKVSATLMLDPNEKIDIETWLPSSRSIAYTKTAWRKAGKYPEYTNFNEDTPYDLALKAAGYKFEDGLKAIVYWRPRPNLREFYRQYYWYAVGDGIDAISAEHFLRLYAKYLIFMLAFVIGALYYLPLAVLVLGLFCVLVFRRIFRPWQKMGGMKTFFLMTTLIIVFDASQLIGYAKGYLQRERLKGSGKLVR